MKLNDEMLEKLKRENEVDNSRFEELLSNFFNLTTDEKLEYLHLFRNLRVFLPVIIKGDFFAGNENAEKGEILRTKEPVGFDINSLSNEHGDAVPVFTSEEKMNEAGFSSSTYVVHMKDLAEMLKQSGKYSFITINPFTQFGLDQPVDLFLKFMFNPNPEVEVINPLNTVLKMLKEKSVELKTSRVFYIKGGINFMMDNAVNGIYTHPVPINASTTEDFLKEYDYLNIILMPKSKKFLFTGGLLEKNHFDIVLAPETEFEFVDVLDEFTTVWKCGAQPFYDDDSNDEVDKIKKIIVDYFSTSEFDKAIYYVNKLLDMNPSDVSCLEIGGFCYMNLGDYENAFNCFNKAIELNPNNASCLHHKATLLENLGRWDEALECRDKLIELNPNDYHLWFFKSFDLISLKKYTDAIRCLDKAIELNPKEPILWYSKGTLFGDLDMYEESLEYLDKALELDPNHTLSLNVKGVSLGHLKRFDEAIECFDKSILLNPNDSYPFQLMGNLFLMGLNNYDEAIIYFKEAIRLGSTDSMLWNNLGDAYLNTKEFEKGLDCCDKARFYDPNNFRAWFTTGEIYYELGKYDLAMEYCEKAEKLNPSDLDLAFFIGKIKQTKDDEKGLVWAIDILKDSIPFKPEDIDNNRNEFEKMLFHKFIVGGPKDDEYNVEVRMHFRPHGDYPLYISDKKVQELKIELERDIEEMGYDGALNKFIKWYRGMFF